MRILILVAVVLSQLHSQSITFERGKSGKFRDSLAVRWLDPRFGEFPDASLVDFSFLLKPPAGKFGFVKVGEDGHFYFEKTGERVRFWGVTIAGSHVDIPKDKIETVVEVLARAGCNLIRLHELDNRGSEKLGISRRCVIDEAYPNENNSKNLDKEYLDRIDYWIYQAQKRGIYVYLVVRAYRTFKSGDGVEGAEMMDRKGSPYSLFDRKMIELQKEFIDDFLFKHVNPYTGLPNGLNPAVAMIELINEDSFFFQYDKLDNMIEPYKTKFQKLWIDFLKRKYRTTHNLKKAWSTKDGFSILRDDESLELEKIYFPKMTLRKFSDVNFNINSNELDHPLRQRDGLEFLMSLQIELFKELKNFIRSKGCPVPLTSTVNSEIIQDTYTVFSELDFIGQNVYMDHPFFETGKEWIGIPFFRNENYLKRKDRWTFPVYSAFYAWKNKPIVIRECSQCFPNEFRVSSFVHLAVYSLLQDYDAVIHFAYYTWGDVNQISSFGFQADPTRWGLFGYAGKVFINGEIKPFSKEIDICFTDDDLKIWTDWWSDVYKLSFKFKVRNKIAGEVKINGGAMNIFSKAIFTDANVRNFVDSLMKANGENDEVKIDFSSGTLFVSSSNFVAVAGEVDTSKIYGLGNIKFKTSSPVVAFVMAGLDGESLTSSKRICVKVVTIAKNYGQIFEKVGEKKFALKNQGRAPVQTNGEISESGTQIWWNDEKFLKGYLKNGSWEVLIDKEKKFVFLFCDTPNIMFEFNKSLFGKGKSKKFYQELGGENFEDVKNGVLVYPGYSKYVLIY